MSAPLIHPDGATAKTHRTCSEYDAECPWCEHEWRPIEIENGEEGVLPCPSCGRHSEIECEITFTFTACPVVTPDELLAKPSEGDGL